MKPQAEVLGKVPYGSLEYTEYFNHRYLLTQRLNDVCGDKYLEYLHAAGIVSVDRRASESKPTGNTKLRLV